MPFNGSGSFQSLALPTFPAFSGDIIYAARFNSNLNDIFAGLTNCVTRDGQSPPSTDLPMNGHKLTGLGDGTATGQALTWNQSGAVKFGGTLEVVGAVTLDTTLTVTGILQTVANVGVGTAPSAWSTPTIDVSGGALTAIATTTELHSNSFYNGTNTLYKANGTAAKYSINSGVGSHTWWTAGAGTAGTVVSYTAEMTLDPSGNLSVGTTNTNGQVTIQANNKVGLYVAGNTTSGGVLNDLTVIRTGGEVATFGQAAGVGLVNSTASTGAALQQYSNNLQFFNFNGGSWNEKMRIDLNGGLGLGGAPNFNGAGSVGLTVNASVQPIYDLNVAGTRTGTMTATGSLLNIGSLTTIPLNLITGNTTRLTVDAVGRLSGTALHNNATLPSGTTQQYIASGTYTPTLAGVNNVAASSVVNPFVWTRVGNVVTVAGVLAVTPTLAGATATNLSVTLPIPSTLPNAQACAGNAVGSGVSPNQVAYISGDASLTKAQLSFFSGFNTSNPMYCTFTYLIA